MDNLRRAKRNLGIFAVFVVLIGWIGLGVDQLAGQASYQDIGTRPDNGTPGMAIWLASPLILMVILRIFGGDGWRNSGFALNMRGNAKYYLIATAIYPAVTVIVLVAGLLSGGIWVSNFSLFAYIGILASQILIQLIKNFFEESVWRGYLTNQLLKFNLPDVVLYLTISSIWWIWHLPYILFFVSTEEIRSTLPVSNIVFWIIGFFMIIPCWTVMYTELFRITRSIWPLVLAHTMEDAVINPLLLLGIVQLDQSRVFVFSLSGGILPSALYLSIGLCLRHWRIRKESLLE